MSDDVHRLCRKRRSPIGRLLFGERDDLEDVCESEGGYCPGCHSRLY